MSTPIEAEIPRWKLTTIVFEWINVWAESAPPRIIRVNSTRAQCLCVKKLKFYYKIKLVPKDMNVLHLHAQSLTLKIKIFCFYLIFIFSNKILPWWIWRCCEWRRQEMQTWERKLNSYLFVHQVVILILIQYLA